MTTPTLTITQLDGALGVLPASTGRVLAIVGASSSGPVGVPATWARARAVETTYGVGPLVEAAAYAIERYGQPVMLVRTETSVAGAASAVTRTGTGTSVITVDEATEPLDDYEPTLTIVAGGTVGTAGITLRWSLDGGRTLSPLTALGTATSFTVPSSGVKWKFAAGTLLAGDTASCRTTAPQWSAAELGAALDALRATATDWGMVEVVGALDVAAFDVIEAKVAACAAAGRDVTWIGSVRLPSAGESEATYLSSLTAAWSSRSSIYGAITAGACEMTSSVSSRRYTRPVAMAVAPRESRLSDEQNSAAIDLGSIPGVAIVDSLGNPLHHDEALTPGLDDARFYALRSWPKRVGAYVNRPRLFCPVGSDFQLLPHRRVMNTALGVLRPYFEERLSKDLVVDETTGFIREDQALAIEVEANARLRTALLKKPKASDAYCVVARNENLLSTGLLSADARVVPLAYAERIALSVGFTNPALAVTTA